MYTNGLNKMIKKFEEIGSLVVKYGSRRKSIVSKSVNDGTTA